MNRIAVTAIIGSLCVPLYAAAGSPASVKPTAQEVGHQINIAGRQRMLLERMSKAFCYARSNVDPVASVGIMTKAKGLFAKSHMGLRDGNNEMGLFNETDRSVKDAWIEVEKNWLLLSDIYGRALGGEFVDEATFAQSVDVTLEARNRANDMVAQLRGAHASSSAGGFGSALLVDLYGRQRMLSQKLSKEVCLVARGHQLEKTRPELGATLELFETSLKAFIEGMPIAGVPLPPTQQIADQLALADSHWQPVRGIAHRVAAGKAVTLVELGQFAKATDRFLPEMNKAVGMLASHVSESN